MKYDKQRIAEKQRIAGDEGINVGDERTIVSDERTIVSVSDLQKQRGVHYFGGSEQDSSAIMRGDKTAVIVNSESHVQKGDFIVIFTKFEDRAKPASCHDVHSRVFQATFVSDIPDTDDPRRSLVCIKPLPGHAFHDGGIGSEFVDDTITITP